MKRLVKATIRKLVSRAPFGVREAMLDGCIDRVGISDICLRLLPKFKIVEVGAEGDRGIVTSAWNDLFVLPEYAATGTFAHTLTTELLTFFGSGDGTYMDVGANIGMTTIPIARNPRVHCLAFEPEPVNFGFLQRNVARNAAGGSVEFHQVALSDSRGSMSLAIADRNIGDHRLTRGAMPGRRTVEISTVPLDDFVDKIKGPLAVKIDTQGAEPFVVAGGREVLARAGLLVMEFCPYLLHELGGDPNTVIELVSTFDRVAIIDDEKPGPPNYIEPAEAQRLLQHKVRTAKASDTDYVDIMAIRGLQRTDRRDG